MLRYIFAAFVGRIIIKSVYEGLMPTRRESAKPIYAIT
jgi:hypothetical protein